MEYVESKHGMVVMDGVRCVARARAPMHKGRPWILRIYGACWVQGRDKPGLKIGNGQRVLSAPDFIAVPAKDVARQVLSQLARTGFPERPIKPVELS